MGVLGDESCAEAGDESVSSAGRSPGVSIESWFGATDVTFDPAESRLSSVKTLVSLDLGDLIVLAFDPLDLTETLDSFVVLPNHEFLELDLVFSSSSS